MKIDKEDIVLIIKHRIDICEEDENLIVKLFRRLIKRDNRYNLYHHFTQEERNQAKDLSVEIISLKDYIDSKIKNK